MDFRPPFRGVPVDGFLLVLGVSCLNIPDWNEGVSVQKPKLFTLSIPFLDKSTFQFPFWRKFTQSVCHLQFQDIGQLRKLHPDVCCQTIILVKSGNY